MFAFAVIIAIVTLNGLSRTQAAYENTLAQGIEIRRLSDQLSVNLLKARRDEEYSLRVDAGEAIYITSFLGGIIAKMPNNLRNLLPLVL
ncbi:MAG: hypothetical protein MZV64_03920 [Ignavibacteriales bacterium]|nr:hypothetical protein [Ignavibacteriales bacterium]